MVEVVSAIILSTASLPFNGAASTPSFRPIPGPKRVLLTQRRLTAAFPMYWETPGGKVQDGESPGVALQRELYEELGISASLYLQLHPAGALQPAPLLRSEYLPGKPITFFEVARFSPMPQPLEGQGMGWFTLNELLMLQLTPGTETARSTIITILDRLETQHPMR